MNKILFLKVLVGFMTFLIFLSLAGIVYGLLFYKKPSKGTVETLIASRHASALQTVSVLYLDQETDAEISGIFPCGTVLCVRISSSFEKDKIAIINPQTNQLSGWVYLGKAP